MGVVLAARDTTLGREVAVKLIRPSFLARASIRERFAREGQAIARFTHPSIARIFEVGYEDSIPYLVMERIEGCTLAEVLDGAATRYAGRPLGRRTGQDFLDCVRDASPGASPRGGNGPSPSNEDGPSDPSDSIPPLVPPLFEGSWAQVCVRIVRAVAEGLDHAHAAGVVHRDVKASNILITPGGRVALIDFGLAHLDSAATLTATGSRLGSLPYTAPECLQADRNPDSVSDVYSLGVVAYELLSLGLPFRAQSEAGLVQQILQGPQRSLAQQHSDWPHPVSAMVMQALRKDPQRRTPSANALAHNASRALHGKQPIPHGDGPLAIVRSRWQSHPRMTLATLLATGLLIALPTWILSVQARGAERVAQASALSWQRLALALEATANLREALPSSPVIEGTALEALRDQVLADLAPIEQRILQERGALPLNHLVLAQEQTQLPSHPAFVHDGTSDAAPDAAALAAAQAWLDENPTPGVEPAESAEQHVRALWGVRLASGRSVEVDRLSIELLQWLAKDAQVRGESGEASRLRRNALERIRSLQTALPGSVWLRARERELTQDPETPLEELPIQGESQ